MKESTYSQARHRHGAQQTVHHTILADSYVRTARPLRCRRSGRGQYSGRRPGRPRRRRRRGRRRRQTRRCRAPRRGRPSRQSPPDAGCGVRGGVTAACTCSAARAGSSREKDSSVGLGGSAAADTAGPCGEGAGGGEAQTRAAARQMAASGGAQQFRPDTNPRPVAAGLEDCRCSFKSFNYYPCAKPRFCA